MSNIRITAFKWVPPFAQGLVRDLRVRWALEEAGLSYTEKLLDPGEQNSPAHRAVQPFGQVPVYEEDGLTLFESGSIVMHIAQKSPVLMPTTDEAARARAHVDIRRAQFGGAARAEPHDHRPVLPQRGMGEAASRRRRKAGEGAARRGRQLTAKAATTSTASSPPAIWS